jgi:UDP-N-acetylglucosamine:LPS N-acetylglucosamine transferase
MSPHKSVILSGSIGQGHSSVAEVCAAALERAGSRVTTIDCMADLGGVGQRIGEFVFRHTLSHPPVFDALHFSQLRTGSRLSDRIERASAQRVTRALFEPAGHADLMLGVFATGAGAAGRIRQSTPRVRTAVLCTDATAHRVWMHPGIERFLVCSTMAAATVRQYQPTADVVEIVPPVRPQFFSVPERRAARAALELDEDRTLILLMSGGWGLGMHAEVAHQLADEGYGVAAVAGSNASLAARLRHEARQASKGEVVAYGYTDGIPDLMAAADVVVTTSGQTCHEARVVGRPLVIMDAVAGHGRENLLLEITKGGALACTPHPRAVVHAVQAALEGVCPPADPWPLSSPHEWDEQFLSSLEGLIPQWEVPKAGANS